MDFGILSQKTLMVISLLSLTKKLICKPSRSSPLQTHIHTRTEIEYSYGPTWFIRMSFRTTDIDHYIEYVNPKSWWN